MKGIYHISSEGQNVIFRSEDDFIYFMNKLGIVTDALGMRLFAFCIMSTHMHAIAEADEAKLFAGSINNLYGRHLNANYGIRGHNMKFSFHALTGMEEIGTALEYVLRNPVHHNVASSAFEYPYSSIRIPYPEIFHSPKRYWNEDSCVAKSILRASQIAGRDRRTIFGRSTPNDNWLIKDGKMILPESYVDVSLTKELYKTFRSYLYGMTQNKVSSGPESSLAAYRVSDLKVCKIVDNTLSKAGCRLDKLTPRIEEELRCTLHEYGANDAQIDRCLWKM